MSNWRLRAAVVIGGLTIFPAAGQAQELLTNGGFELVSEADAGRNSVPPGWQMEEGPKVPELPPNVPPTTPAGTYPGDYNSGGVPAIPCTGFLCGAVDAADYTVWRDHLGQNFQLPNEVPGTSTGSVTNGDYLRWKELFGRPNVLSMAEPTNFTHLQLEQEWYMWFQPYYGTFAQAEDNFAHLTQTVPGTPGWNYTLSGWALFESHFAGGRTNLNLAGSSDTPPDDGPLSPTDTFFALEFLDSGGAVLSLEEIELMADGQINNTLWTEHILSAVAPAGTTSVRVQVSMIDGVLNPNVDPQSFFVDQFSLTAAPGSGAGSAVPEPASMCLGAFAVAALVALRTRPRVRRLEIANRD